MPYLDKKKKAENAKKLYSTPEGKAKAKIRRDRYRQKFKTKEKRHLQSIKYRNRSNVSWTGLNRRYLGRLRDEISSHIQSE